MIKIIPLTAITPLELYNSGLSDWGLQELIQLFDIGETHWAYPIDCFVSEGMFGPTKSIVEVEKLDEMK